MRPVIYAATSTHFFVIGLGGRKKANFCAPSNENAFLQVHFFSIFLKMYPFQMHKNKPWRREAVITRKTWNQDSHLFSKLAISYKFPCKTKYGSPSPKIMEFEETKVSQFFCQMHKKVPLDLSN